ncbi:hypothetical protein [Kurthia sibirica]|uniref:Uncharacterized protein n=1 Tax=Kurthia sibirica TaxID=202750 RepID=A0A2U3AGS6_9BACL|nr:hypothetical protein [Kurthia sibirica]PWI23725.1 hypothetical protein DEX24_15640 [Kurthia sibirica]GEK35510.1 hypothetical protein KSI01_30430 [Kurthia sibirica]
MTELAVLIAETKHHSMLFKQILETFESCNSEPKVDFKMDYHSTLPHLQTALNELYEVKLNSYDYPESSIEMEICNTETTETFVKCFNNLQELVVNILEQQMCINKLDELVQLLSNTPYYQGEFHHYFWTAGIPNLKFSVTKELEISVTYRASNDIYELQILDSMKDEGVQTYFQTSELALDFISTFQAFALLD